jgi:hypothetical protein
MDTVKVHGLDWTAMYYIGKGVEIEQFFMLLKGAIKQSKGE